MGCRRSQVRVLSPRLFESSSPSASTSKGFLIASAAQPRKEPHGPPPALAPHSPFRRGGLDCRRHCLDGPAPSQERLHRPPRPPRGRLHGLPPQERHPARQLCL